MVLPISSWILFVFDIIIRDLKAEIVLYFYTTNQWKKLTGYFCNGTLLQFSYICSQTAVIFLKTSCDMKKIPVIIKLSRKNTTDRLLPFFSTGVREAKEKLMWNLDIVLFLATGASSIIWDHFWWYRSSSWRSGETVAQTVVCWHITYLHRHTNNQTNQRDYDSTPFEICIQMAVSMADLTVGILFLGWFDCRITFPPSGHP